MNTFGVRVERTKFKLLGFSESTALHSIIGFVVTGSGRKPIAQPAHGMGVVLVDRGASSADCHPTVDTNVEVHAPVRIVSQRKLFGFQHGASGERQRCGMVIGSYSAAVGIAWPQKSQTR